MANSGFYLQLLYEKKDRLNSREPSIKVLNRVGVSKQRVMHKIFPDLGKVTQVKVLKPKCLRLHT